VNDRPNADSGKVPLRLRVGVSGHRDIMASFPGLDQVLRYVCDVVIRGREAIAAAATPTGLTVVSSLAEGADRLVVHAVAAAYGQSPDACQLEAILPLDRASYCEDFQSAESKHEFSVLLAGAVVTEVVQPAASRDDAYESAGEAVVDRSDVMVFIWDGQPARGRGGTADIFAYALQRRKSIFWICTEDGRAELALEPRARPAPLQPAAAKHFNRYNKEPLPTAAAANGTPLLLGLSTLGLDGAAQLSEHISCYFTRADAVAKRLQRRWFWLTRLLYALAAIAVAIVATQVIYEPRHERYAWFEFGVLLCVTALLLLAHFSAWHDRWISSRYLAERIRSLVFLGLAGVAAYHDTLPRPPESRSGDDGSWTDRAVDEIWWSRPRYVPEKDNFQATRGVLDSQWITDQLKYHVRTYRKYEDRARRFTWIAISLFAVSAVAALIHSTGVAQPHSLWSFLSIVVPAVGAALSGYSAQRDYMRHSERSRLFAVSLDQARSQLATADHLRDLQQVALSVATLMRGEASDWFSTVRLQDVEPP
jgi:hypothetical protein